MTYEPPVRRQRWLSVYNPCEITIPGYALLTLRTNDGGGWFAQTSIDGQTAWRVYRCDDTSAARQDPALCLVNGPTPIPPKSYGKATQDWPAQVLMATQFGVGVQCGPQSGSWRVNGGVATSGIEDKPDLQFERSAFVLLSVDHANNVSSGLNSDVAVEIDEQLLGWIAPNVAQRVAVPFARCTGPLTSPYAADTLVGIVEADALGVTVTADGTIAIPLSGLWHVSFSATVWSTDIDRGETLSLLIHRNGLATTGIGAQRTNYVEQDQYGVPTFYTKENIAAAGVIELDKNDTITLVNTSEGQLSIANVVLSLHWLSVPEQDQTKTGRPNWRNNPGVCSSTDNGTPGVSGGAGSEDVGGGNGGGPEETPI